MKLYTSDLHLGHYNIIRMDGRPFTTTDEMDKLIIDNWNKRVQDNDDVYIIGDLAFRGQSPSVYLKLLKGRKHLIVGNHDAPWTDNGSKFYDKEAIGYLNSVKQMDYINDSLGDEKVQIHLSHYPLAERNGFFRGSYLIYGHIHNNTNDAYHFMKQYDRALNAACCINNYVPCSLRELIENNKIFKELH